ncbi:hypothetical protein CRE_27426 [Caenorhabditis remanei]|uniref:C2H2-type domain-containing protein n=1 Tax=Caenorhabditis remanei TaxID=31234 RepID=E3LNJ7_CAERE|nr:hypothetical protein CRE_27426 [Caenorhabditis remanei]
MTDEIEDHHLAEEMYVNPYLQLKHSQPRFKCPYGCNKLIASRTIDYHKNNGCGRRHNDTIAHPELKKRFYCCGSCLAEFVTRNEFHDHLRLEHDVHPEIHNMSFPDRQTFDRFKFWLEAEGGAHFRHKSGAKRRARGKGIFLACNRSGNVGEKTTGSERTGPFRLGFTCTAYIHATEHHDGRVTAEFCGDHYGHDARMRLPNVIKYIIAQKQMDQCTPMEIIGYLRHHFLNYSGENIYAQRICFVDTDELKSILVSCTKKWVRTNIPTTVELWEEELLEKVGIETSLVPRRFSESRRPTTSEIAIQENWPRPRVFLAKTRREDGVLVPFDMAPGDSQSGHQDEYGQEEEEEEMVDEPYMSIEMGEYEVDGYVQETQMVVGEEEVSEVVVTQEYQSHQDIMSKGNDLIDEGEVDVEVGNEVVVTSVSSNDRIIDDKSCVDERVVLSSPNNEIVIVDGDVEEEIDEHIHHHHHHHHAHHRQQHQLQHEHQHDDSDQPGTSNVVERYIEANKANTLEQVMEEIEAFKITVLKRAENTSPANLKSLLIRFQTLHSSIMEKDQLEPVNNSLTVFPNRSKFFYRPGKGLEKNEPEYLQRGTGDISLQPIEDEISDDEELMAGNASVMQYNVGIWS